MSTTAFEPVAMLLMFTAKAVISSGSPDVCELAAPAIASAAMAVAAIVNRHLFIDLISFQVA
jgi:hypothetical protein